MAYQIAKEFPNDFLFVNESPLISIYLTTHRQIPERKQDPVLFKNLAREAGHELRQKYSKRDIASIEDLFAQIAGDEHLWNHPQEGLAIFASQSGCIIYRLPKPVSALAIVADSFHIKPLIRMYQTDDRYQLLGLDRNEFALFEGNSVNIEELKFDPQTPRTIEAVLGNQVTEEYLSHGSYGGSNSPVHHGQGGRKDEIDKDNEKFLRYIDKFVLENYSKQSKLPLILVALAEYHNIFMKMSNNPYLQKEGIKGSFQAFKLEQLKEKALEVLAPVHARKIVTMLDTLQTAFSNSLASDNLETIAKASFESRVGTLLIEAERIIPGRINRDTGEIKLGRLDDPDTDDILDDLAELVMAQKGDVVVLPKERMISDTGIAAIFRY